MKQLMLAVIGQRRNGKNIRVADYRSPDNLHIPFSKPQKHHIWRTPMNLTRILSLLLATVMLLGVFCACGESTVEPDVTASDTTPTDTAPESEAVTELTDNLPDDLDYGEDEIVILSRYREGWTSGEISVPELKSEPVNDSVFERNKAVEKSTKSAVKAINGKLDRVITRQEG